MGKVNDIRGTRQDVMLDIDAELRYWRGCYRESAFHRVPVEFEIGRASCRERVFVGV